MTIRELWSRAGRPVRVLAVVLPLVGVALLLLGLLADQSGWWASRPFLTNLISGFTSACFGVPFALVVLTSLTAAQTSELERRRAEALFARAISDFRARVERITAEPDGDPLDVAIDELTRNVMRPLDRLDAGEAASSVAAELREALSTLHRYLRKNLSYPLDMRERWAGLVSEWRFLDSHVRPTVMAQRLEWVRADIGQRLDTLLPGGTHPLLPAVALLDDFESLFKTVGDSSGRTTATLLGEPGTRAELARLRDALVGVRARLPDVMRLRECMAVIDGRAFAVDLTEGYGLQI